MHSRYRLSMQHQIERLVIGRMRQGAVDSYGLLAVMAKQAGWSILPPDAPFLSQDEVAILGHLASRQRQWDGRSVEPPAALAAQIDRCAAELKADGFRLPYISLQRLGFASEARERNRTMPTNPDLWACRSKGRWRNAAVRLRP